MAFKFKGSVKILGAYDVNTKRPLDNRNVVQKVEDLYKIPYHYSYEGMPVVVVETSDIYVLRDDHKRGSPEGWKRIGGVDSIDDIIDLESFRTKINDVIDGRILTPEEVTKIINRCF